MLLIHLAGHIKIGQPHQSIIHPELDLFRKAKLLPCLVVNDQGLINFNAAEFIINKRSQNKMVTVFILFIMTVNEHVIYKIMDKIINLLESNLIVDHI